MPVNSAKNITPAWTQGIPLPQKHAATSSPSSTLIAKSYRTINSGSGRIEWKHIVELNNVQKKEGLDADSQQTDRYSCQFQQPKNEGFPGGTDMKQLGCSGPPDTERSWLRTIE